MRTLKFHYAGAWNFLPFGPKGIEINFNQLGKIVFIRGENKDVKPIDNDTNLSETITSSNGVGKCFRKNTSILMFDGTIELVQNIKIGDQVMGPDSKPRTVLSLGRGKEMMYEIAPKKGNSYFVNASHILTLKPLFKKRPSKSLPTKGDEILNISVKDFINLPKSQQMLYGTYRTGVDFPEQSVLVDPYFLGIWLGDGTKNKTEITTADSAVYKSFEKEAMRRKLRVTTYMQEKTIAVRSLISSHQKSDKKTNSFLGNECCLLKEKGFSLVEISNILSKKYKRLIRASSVGRWIKNGFSEFSNENTLLSDLRQLGLMPNKFIPHEYKYNSREIRLQILAGILDTDGSLAGQTGYEFVNKNRQLVDDVAFLARSLGYAAIVTPSYKKCYNNGVVGLYYRVSIFGNCDEIPVRILRKKAKKRMILKDHLKSAITVTPVGEEDYYGFAVDGDHLFLLGDFTVVHNSSLLDVLCWTLYGKTVKTPSKIKSDGVINNLIGKGCKTVVVVDNYRIERGRKPNYLRLWKSDTHVWDDSTEITQGDMRVIQKRIEDEVTGLSYDAFINICIFTDQQNSCFLECDTPTKREIVENLLSLSTYRQRHEVANNTLKTLKNSIKMLSREYEILLSSKSQAEERIQKTLNNETSWKTTRLAEVKRLIEQIKSKTLTLQNSDTGAALLAYQQAQEQIKIITPEIDSLEAAQTQRLEKLSLAKEKNSAIKEESRQLTEQIQDCQKNIKTHQAEIKTKENLVNRLQAKEPGQKCTECYGIIDETNYHFTCASETKQITDLKELIAQEMTKAQTLLEEVKKVKSKQERLAEIILEGEKKVNEVNNQLKMLRNQLVAASQVREPKADSAELLIQQQIEELKEQTKAKKIEAEGPSPFVEILANDRLEAQKAIQICEEKAKEIKEAENKIPYYEYWLKAYGDKGIRKWVVDGIIPALNNRIAYWLQFLIDNKISLKFDNELNELIERNPVDGDPYIYHAMSAGQRRRLNLAVSQAFAHIMMLSTGTVPSFVFLDEVTTNIDILGTIGIYNMITELAVDKQIFVTTHDPELMRMLEGVDVLDLVHENGITTLK